MTQGCGDTLFVFDSGEGYGSLSVFSPGLRFVSTSRIQSSEASSARPLRLLSDASVIFWGSNRASYAPGKATPYRGEIGVVRFSRVRW